MPVTGKELIGELLRAGFAVKRISGSHFVLVRDEVVVVVLVTIRIFLKERKCQ